MAKTPDLGSEEILEPFPLLVDKQVSRFRSCMGSALSLAQDRTDIQRAVGMLAADLAKPTEHTCISDLGVSMPKVDYKKYKKCVIQQNTYSDSDHGGKEAKRKSTTCGVSFADGVALATLVRRQDLIAVSSGESEFYVCLAHVI